MNSGSMADKLREAMEKKKGGQNSFSMAGQYTSTVERDGDREFVMYDAPNGEQIKVYGNWNEYAVSQDENGGMMIADEDYPIVEDQNGDFVLDEATFEGQSRGNQMGNKAQGGPGASKMDDLMQMLNQSRGAGGAQAPGMKYGGKIYNGGGKLPPERFYARPEPVNMNDPDSPMTIGFYDEGRKVTSQDFARALESAGEGGHIQDYVKSGVKYGPRFDRSSGSWSYSSQDARTHRFNKQRRERREGN